FNNPGMALSSAENLFYPVKLSGKIVTFSGKGKFKEIMPRRFGGSTIAFKTEILRCYDVDTARRKNTSFAYLFNKHLQPLCY
ncbi:MAG: hypothetical protein JW765_00395, partial [Deltaproteobacteria bacterium]|nr:hypothetical protein [Candidatus Zymogenaceae bacterium]